MDGLVAFAQNAPTTAPAPRASYSERYSVLSDGNIFLRERGRRNDRRGSRTSAPASPEQSFVLTGIVFEAGEYHAYLEDVARASVQKLSIGQPVARGQVGEIQIDAIAYDADGARTWVDIGSNLTGTPVASVSAARIQAAAQGAASSRSASTPSAGAPALPATGANLSIEERMRLRRMQESGQAPPAVEQPAVEQPAPIIITEPTPILIPVPQGPEAEQPQQ